MGEFLKNTFFVWLMGMLIMLKLCILVCGIVLALVGPAILCDTLKNDWFLLIYVFYFFVLVPIFFGTGDC